tara:strand:- start:4204 stop:4557 length:354 start_codon:yes stop_codon:yes gene_type:complete
MARDNDEIESIISELEDARTARDIIINAEVERLTSIDSKNAERLRSVNHDKEISLGNCVCVHDRIIRDDDNNILMMIHNRYDYLDSTYADGETFSGLRSRLIDESFNIECYYTVDNI